jgi:hypothetical protein
MSDLKLAIGTGTLGVDNSLGDSFTWRSEALASSHTTYT